MANRTPVEDTAKAEKLQALQAATAGESQRHLLARIDDLTRRSIELHAEVILRDNELADLRAKVAELESAAKPKPPAKKATRRRGAAAT